MKKLLLAGASVLATLAFATTALASEAPPTVAAAVAHTPSVGDSYYRGTTPHELAVIMRAYFLAHPNDLEGKGLLDPEKCHLPVGRSCASAWDYLISFQHSDPDAGLTSVGQLPDFLDSLVLVIPEDSEYNMDALTPVGEDVFSPNLGVLARKFQVDPTTGKREAAYGDPKHGNKIVFAVNCGNPVQSIHDGPVVTGGFGDKDHPCWHAHVFGNAHDNFHVVVLLTPGESLAEDKKTCLATFPKPCPGLKGCDFSDTERVSKMLVFKTGDMEDIADGDHVIDVPPGWTIAICRKGYRTQHLIPADYKNGEAWILRTPTDKLDSDKPGAWVLFWKPVTVTQPSA